MAYLPDANVAGAGAISQQTFCSTLGVLFIPLYNARGGDIVMAVDNGANAVTRTYTPVITSPINTKEMSAVSQSKASTGGSANTSKAIISMTE